MSSYFDGVIDAIQHQRWHGHCSPDSLQVLGSVGFHSCILRNDDRVSDAVKLCVLRNLRSVDERLTQEELRQWEGAHPAGVLHVGRTPIMTAVWTNAMAALHLLRGAGASFTTRCAEDNGLTALHYAVMLRRVDMVRYMLPLLPKEQLTARCKATGDTPLHMAARRGHYEMVLIFVQHAERLHKEDAFVWRQLHQEATTPPPCSGLVRALALRRSFVDGCTAAHLIARCRTAGDGGGGDSGQGEPDVAASATDGMDHSVLETTAEVALQHLIDAAARHDCLEHLLSRSFSCDDQCLLATCGSPVLWHVVKRAMDGIGCAVAWRASPKQYPNAAALEAAEHDDDGDAAIAPAQASSPPSSPALRKSGSVAAEPPDSTAHAAPILTSAGETPLHRLALHANAAGGGGMVRLWLACLAGMVPDAPPSTAASYAHLLALPSPLSGKSAWFAATEAFGADNATVMEMVSVTAEADALEESRHAEEACNKPSAEDGAHGALSTSQEQLATMDSPYQPPLPDGTMASDRISVASCGVVQLLTSFPNERNKRTLLHHLAWHGDAAGLAWVRQQTIAHVLERIRGATAGWHVTDAATTTAMLCERPTSAGSCGGGTAVENALPSALLATRAGSPSPPAARAVASPTVVGVVPSHFSDRPNSRQSDDLVNNNSFVSAGSDSTTANGGNVSTAHELASRSALAFLSDLLSQTACLYRQLLLSEDQDRFTPLLVASLRDQDATLQELCKLSDDIAAVGGLLCVLMAQHAARITKAHRAAAAAAAQAAELTSNRSMRRTTSNMKKTASFSASGSMQKSPSLAHSGLGQQGGGDLEATPSLAKSGSMALPLSASFSSPSKTSALVADVKELLTPQIPDVFGVVLQDLLSQMELNFIAFDAAAATEVAGTSPNDDPSAALARVATLVEAREWEALMRPDPTNIEGDQPGILPLVHAATAVTVPWLLSQTHPIRTATTAVHLSVEAGAATSVRLLVGEALRRWQEETDRTAGELATDVAAQRNPPVLKACAEVLREWLLAGGSEWNKHRNVVHIAVHSGDVRVLNSLLGALTDAAAHANKPTDAEASYSWMLTKPRISELATSMAALWGGATGAFRDTPSLKEEADRLCIRRLRCGETVDPSVQPLSIAESSMYIAPEPSDAADDDEARIEALLGFEFTTRCCDGAGGAPQLSIVSREQLTCRSTMMVDALRRFILLVCE